MNQIGSLQKWNLDSQKPQEEGRAATSQSTFQKAQKYVFAHMVVYMCVCVHKGSNTGFLWPQKHHLKGRAGPTGSSEQVYTPYILVYTLAHLCTLVSSSNFWEWAPSLTPHSVQLLGRPALAPPSTLLPSSCSGNKVGPHFSQVHVPGSGVLVLRLLCLGPQL